jgi:uncharacterized Zn finger protein (UPF0148 family)
MRLITLNCNECGAPLEVPGKTRFVTCAYCSSRLEIHQSGNAYYSEVLERLEQKSAHIADEVETLRIQNDLERVDREWTIDREKYQMRGKHGHLYVPTKSGSIIGGVLIVVFGGFWTVGAASMGAPFFFPLFGVAFIILGIFQSIRGLTMADEYTRRQQKYQRDRRAISNRLRHLDDAP